MVNKFLVLASLISSVSYAQEVPTLSAEQIVQNESAMAIMQDAQAQHITLAKVKPFLATENATADVRNMVVSYIAQGLSFSDFSKLAEGVYTTIPKVGVSAKSSQVHYGQKCYNAVVGRDYCYNAVNWTCTDVGSSSCM